MKTLWTNKPEEDGWYLGEDALIRPIKVININPTLKLRTAVFDTGKVGFLTDYKGQWYKIEMPTTSEPSCLPTTTQE